MNMMLAFFLLGCIGGLIIFLMWFFKAEMKTQNTTLKIVVPILCAVLFFVAWALICAEQRADYFAKMYYQY